MPRLCLFSILWVASTKTNLRHMMDIHAIDVIDAISSFRWAAAYVSIDLVSFIGVTWTGAPTAVLQSDDAVTAGKSSLDAFFNCFLTILVISVQNAI